MAERRRQNLTDESVAPSLRENAAIANRYVVGADVVNIGYSTTTVDTLQRYLSVRSVLSTASSSAVAQEEAKDKGVPFHDIGEGFCAIIYDIPGTGKVVKIAKPNKQNELWTDFGAHLSIYEASKSSDALFCVPRPAYYVAAKDVMDWLKEHKQQLPKGVGTSEPNDMLCSERIMPLPKLIREALIDVFCPKDQVKAALENTYNKSCLARLYLGRRRANVQAPGSFSLRNFELTLDKLDVLGIRPLQFIRPIAEALALVHWKALSDGRDVEFVLGSSPERRITARDFGILDSTTPRVTTWKKSSNIDDNPNFLKRTVSVWLLDFNQCSRISADSQGIRMAADAFWQNDPYYPRPNKDTTTDEYLYWSIFKDVYMTKGKEILGEGATQPEEFITLIEAEAEEKQVDLVMRGPPKAPVIESEASSSKADSTGNADKKEKKDKKKKHRKFFSAA
ncbi:hypothetical protein CGCSCA1_v014078 [Colletotrichum siamense]|nr:hypothetical protein CGCSCA1_v014078 [Colletotrichum siamense]